MSFTRAHFIALLYSLFLATSLLLPASAFRKFTFTSLFELDKLIHFIMFYLFSSFWLLAIVQKQVITRKNQILVLVCGILYGFTLESLQSIGSLERSFEYGDLIANTLGAIVGVISIKGALNFVTFLKKYLPFMQKLYK